MKIKDIIYNEAIKLNGVNDLTTEEISSLVFYKVLNQPYFKDSYKFISLGYNEYGKLALGHFDLNNVEGITNDSTKSNTIYFNQKDDYPQYSFVNEILSENNKKLLLEYKQLIIESDTLEDLIEKINQKEINDPLYYQKIRQINREEKHSYKMKPLSAVLDSVIKINPENQDLIDQSEFIHKITYYRNLFFDFSSVRDLLPSQTNDVLKWNKDEVKENILKEDFHLDSMFIGYRLNEFTPINLKEWSTYTPEEKLSSFEMIQSIPSIYENCMLKYILEHETREERLLKILNKKAYSILKKNSLLNLDNIIIKETLESVFSKYDHIINPVLEKVQEHYPLLKQSTEEMTTSFTMISPSLKTGRHNTTKKLSNFIEKSDNISLYSNDNFSDQQALKGLRSSTYSVLSGESDSKYSFFINNEIENFAHGYCIKRELYDNKKFNSYTLYRTDFIPSLYDDKYLKMIIDPILKACRKDKFIFAYDIYRPEGYHKKIFDYIKSIKKDNPDIIFYNNGSRDNPIDAYDYSIKKEMLKQSGELDLPYEKLIIINKKIDDYINKTDIEALDNSFKDQGYQSKRDFITKIVQDYIKELESPKIINKMGLK